MLISKYFDADFKFSVMLISKSFDADFKFLMLISQKNVCEIMFTRFMQGLC